MLRWKRTVPNPLNLRFSFRMPLGRTFLKSTSVLLLGTVVAQAITFVLSFVIARTYSPDDFGRFTIFLGIAAVLAAASTGAFERVILLADSFEEARQAGTLTLVSSTSVAIATLVTGVVAALFDLHKLSPLTMIDALIFLPLFIIFYGASQVYIYSSLRINTVSALATLKVTQSAAMGGIQLTTASLSTLSGLVLGNVAGWFLLAIAGWRWRLRAGHFREDLRKNSLAEVARKNWRYPRYVMPNEAIDNLSGQAPLVLIGTFVSVHYAGHYGLATMMLSAPGAVAGQAIGQSFMQYLGSPGKDSASVRKAMFQIWLALSCVGIVPFGAVLIYGPTLFEFAFGANWRDAGEIAQALTLLLFVRFVSSPTSSVYLKLGLQKEQWRFCLAAACYRIGAYSLGAFGYSLIAMIWIHVAFEIVAILAYNCFALLRLDRLHNGATATIA